MENSGWKKDYEFKQMSANALLLPFDKPITYDLYIPGFDDLKTSIQIVGDILKGKSVDISKVDCCFDMNYPKYPEFDSFTKFPERVIKGLEKIFFMKDRDSTAFLEEYLMNKSLFGNEFVYGFGTLYRFREGKRKEVGEGIKGYFKTKEREAFEEIGKLMVPYAGRLHLPHKSKD